MESPEEGIRDNLPAENSHWLPQVGFRQGFPGKPLAIAMVICYTWITNKKRNKDTDR